MMNDYDDIGQYVAKLEAENAALRKQIEELELQVALLMSSKVYEYKIEGSGTTNLIEYTADNRTYDGEGVA